MKDMEKDKEIEDDFIKNLMNKVDLEQPPADFTLKIMDKIQTGIITETVEAKPWLSKLNWLIFCIAFISIGIFCLVFDFTNFGFRNELPVFNTIGIYLNSIADYLITGSHTLGRAFASFKSSPVIIAVLFAIPLLFGFDRLLRKPEATHKAFIF
jgi:hypothetical protein